jgi:hypothetical protein
VGIDISGSRNKTELDESKKLLDGLIDRLQAGDHLTLIEAYQGGRIPARQWSDSIRAPRNGKPTASDNRRAEDFKTIARIQTSILFDSAREGGHDHRHLRHASALRITRRLHAIGRRHC